MDGSVDINVKKKSVEELSRDELIARCNSLLAIAQKAKQSKDAAIEENSKLKQQLTKQQSFSSEDVIERLTKQKVDLLTNLEELKNDKIRLDNKLSNCETQLFAAESKISDLDIANQSYKRRVDRLTEENEQLITHLDDLEKQIDELKTIGLQQQQQLLVLEKNNISLANTNDNINQQLQEQASQTKDDNDSPLTELKNALDVSLEEVKYLKSENATLSNNLKEFETLAINKEQTICLKDNELAEINKLIESLQLEINNSNSHKDEMLAELTESDKKVKYLETELNQAKEVINSLKKDIDEKNVESEKYANVVDDLKTDLHKNKALVEKLQQDILNMNQKLSDNQIMSSGVASDLQNANEKLKEKLKIYHSKIVKFANDIKFLKQSKIDLVSTFKLYTWQVSEWKERLNLLLNKIECQDKENKEILSQNQQYKSIIDEKCQQNEKLIEGLTELEKYKECFGEYEKLNDLNKSLKDEINILHQKLEEQNVVTGAMDKIQAEYESKKVELTEQYRQCFENSQKLIEENNILKSCINDLNNEIEKFQETQAILESLKQELDESNAIIANNEKEITNLNNNCVSMVEEKEILEKTLSNLQQQYIDLTKQNTEDRNRVESAKCQYELKLNQQKEEYERENNKILEQYEARTENLEIVSRENNQLKANIETFLDEKQNLLLKVQNVELENSNLHKKMEEFNVLLENLDATKSMMNSLRNELEDNKKQIINLENMNRNLKDQLNNSNKYELALAEKSGEEIINLVEKNNESLEVIKKLEAEIQNITNKSSSSSTEIQTDNDLYNFEELISSLKRENAELLSEMNEMNQALKERGETISKQEAHGEEMLKKLQSYELQFKGNKDILNKKDESIEMLKQEINSLKVTNKSLNFESVDVSTRKDDEISQLRMEIQELRDKLLSTSQSDVHSDIHYAESENMSTSTISKTEEINRMKDLDSSWEERYGKLRNLALKQKGKIRDLMAELQKEQGDKSDLQQKQAKTIQTFQQQIDKLQDDLEISKSDCKQYLKKLDSMALEVSNDKKSIAQNEEVISQLTSEIDGLNKEKTNTDNWKKQVSAKIQALKKELEANNLLKKEFENKISKLSAELESKDKALKQEIERHNQTKTVLQESNNECKKQSVLNLEMQDYERSVKELSQKVDKKQELINKLKTQLETQKTSLNTLKDQNQDLEGTIKSWEDNCDKLNSENEFNKKKINELENSLSEKDNKLQDLTYMIENIRSDNEDLSTQLSKAIAEHQKNNATLKEECDLLKSRNMGLEQTLREVQEVFRMKEQECSEMQREYEGYKVRAQSVLRQNQNRDVSAEEKLTEEAASLQAQVNILTTQLKDIRSTLDETKLNNDKLQAEHEDLHENYKGLQLLVENQKKSYEELFGKHQQMISEHAETVRGLKIHSDTLAQCYRQQLSEQESRHNREIIELQGKIERGNTPPESSIIIPSMPREEGEGSESVESVPNNGNQPISLEKLLSNETEHEVINMKKQLGENESKVVHLTALLADTEQDLAKYVQLNKVLKEEIRRQQRSAEREKHAENLEYLKNVVFKFITLGNGDERSRLVPVLNTILKLSPEETLKLNSVAKGEKGWSNYLPISWGSPNKPQ